MVATKELDFAAALKDPKGNFGTPERVLNDNRLTKDQKVKLLRAWEQDARALAVAEEEGMGGGESDMLQKVQLALKSICEDEPAPPATTKHGGSGG